MVNPQSHTKLHSIHNLNYSPSKPNPIMRSTKFLFKSIVCALFLFSLPLFPSQAPDFVGDTVLTKFWELLHLLFIGIAVSYGVFSRRNVHSPADIADIPTTRTSDFLSIFDDGYDEKVRVQAWSSFSQGESIGVTPDEISSALLEKLKPKPYSSENGVEIPGMYSEKSSVHQSWNSQYFQCQPMIVVARPNYTPGDECEKPLGLPIRSLRSRTVEPTRFKPRGRTGSESSSSSRSNSRDSLKSTVSCKNVKFGEVGPLNLEEKFGESVSFPSPIPWRSRSGRMEMRENLSSLKQPLHSRHLSVEEESQFMYNRSGSFGSNPDVSLLSHHSSVPFSSQNGLSELHDLGVENLVKKKSDSKVSDAVKAGGGLDSFFELNSSAFGSANFNAGFYKNGVNGNLSCQEELSSFSVRHGAGKNGVNGHRYSKSELGCNIETPSNLGSEFPAYDYFADTNGGRSFKDQSEGLAWSRRKENSSQSQKSKASLRGKSVRTFRQAAEMKGREQKTESKITDDRVLENHNHARSLPNEFTTTINYKHDLEKSCSVPKRKFCDESSNAEAVVDDCVSDAGTEANEVDKKAGEFIAKFREQIQLQKTASIDGSINLDLDESLVDEQ